ncbi:MAG TPA: ABC transporter permease, partial [Gemmatimonadaceae bacterium]
MSRFIDVMLTRIVGRALRRLAYWWRFREEQDALREELDFHRELLAEDLRRRNAPADAVEFATRRAMGNETLARETARGVWLSFALESVLQDCRYAWRGMRRSPLFAALVVLTIALTIAANAMVFSVVHRVLLEPLPFADGNRIVRIGTTTAADPLVVRFGIRAELLRRFRARSRTLNEFAAVRSGRATIGARADSETMAVAGITPSLLPTLRIEPLLGRPFTDADLRRDAPPIALLGYALWQGRYAGARDVIGRTLDVAGTTRTIVGILPPHFDIPMSLDETPAVWVPLDVDSARAVDNAFARLMPKATTRDASRELDLIVRELPDTGSLKGIRASVTSARDEIDPSHQRAIGLLFAGVWGLLLLACANISTLLLMRGWSRQRELAIRSALGGDRIRLAQQLLIESLLLATLGGILGLVIVRIGLPALIAMHPADLVLGTVADLSVVRVDRAVLLWTLALTLVTGVVVGLGPAFFAGRSGASLAEGLRAGTPMISSGSASRRLRNALVVVQFTLSLTFLAAAALLGRSFVALTHAPTGLDQRGLITITVRRDVASPSANTPIFEQSLVNALRAIPGVTDAAFGGGLAQTDVRMGPFATEGPTGPHDVDLPLCEMPFVGGDYFRVARIALVEGRSFDTRDPEIARREVVINQKLARRLWPDGRAIGAKLRVPSGGRAEWLTVVGVAADVYLPGIDGDLFNLKMYRPTTAASQSISAITLRTAIAGAALEPALRRAVDAAGVSARLDRIWMTESLIDRRVLSRPRFAVVICGVFAALALAVCTAGLYGIVAYAVTQRTREIGVRLALGATAGGIVRLVLADTARLVAWGTGLGL